MFDDPIIVDDDDDDDMTDWIPIVGHLMPGAKLTKARDIVAAWLAEAPDTKVVIFTQFRSIIEIFRFICENEQRGYALLTGDMSFTHRDASMQEFRGKPELRVMIASLKAGGIGIDMTMANKCILVDPWWNEAVQQQVGPGTRNSLLISNAIFLTSPTFLNHAGILSSLPDRPGEERGSRQAGERHNRGLHPRHANPENGGDRQDHRRGGSF